ncbi:MAG TPA: thioredoxin family protein [Thermoanaerobaculia bacterium]|nr:thioredoxin family protein [Thermoanaerobaculia bacterium]
MKRIASIAALLVLMAAPQAVAAGGFLKTLGAAQKAAKEKNQLIFVDLFAAWCGWCHRFDKEVVPSEAFQNATDDMVLLRLDTEDGKEGTQFSRQYGVNSLPTFLVLTPDLSVAAVIRGFAPPAQFAEMLNGSVDKYRAFEKLVARESSLAKDYSKRLEIAREFRNRQAWGESEKRLRKLVAEPGVPVEVRDEAYYELGILYNQQGKHDQVLKTLADFAKVQKQGVMFERSKMLLASTYLALGNYRGAVDELRAFKTRFPKSSMMVQVEQMLPIIEQMASTQ